jgi:hypothetical protein
MLTYNDCLALSGLSQEEVSALARIKHLPEVVALEMGWSLCRTPQGKQVIRQMILDDIEAACRRGDAAGAAKLGLVLHHFLEAHCAQDAPATPGADDDGRPAHALHPDTTAASWARERLDTYHTEMLRRFGLDPASARERFPTQMHVAEMCCAACAETGRCRRFLVGAADAEVPSDFCPNAPLLGELGRRCLRSHEPA